MQYNISVLGSAFIGCLLLKEAHEVNLSIRCYDSKNERQGDIIFGTKIYKPELLKQIEGNNNILIFSSEKGQENSLVHYIKTINPKINTISWKDLILLG